MRTPAKAVSIVVSVGAVAWIVYLTGGTHTAYPHLGYIPVIVAAFMFGAPGGALVGCLTGLAIGPVMPLDTVLDIDQPFGNWVMRTGFFVLVGVTAGFLFRRVRQQITELQSLADRHPVTGLRNVRALEEDLAEALRAAGPDGCVALTQIEIEGEDRLLASVGPGHVDAMLGTVARRLESVLADGMRLYHLRSSRFAIVAPGLDLRAARQHAAALLASVRRSVVVEGIPVYLEARSGAACYPQHAKDATALIASSVVALQAAADTGGESAIYDPRTARRYSDAYALLNDLSQALEASRGLHLHFQPIVDPHTGACIAAEALVRWEHPERGAVSPGEFIPLAERTGLITPLTAWVTDRAMRAAAQWQEAGLECGVAINLSATNLTETGFARDLAELACGHGLEPGLVELEVTETAIMGDPQEAIETLWQLRRRGFLIAIDDFGTGHSSLAYLKSLPVDSIKIDGGFLKSLETDPADALIVRSTINLAEGLGLETVVEGIEHEETLSRMRAWRATRVQGYHIARPMQLDAFVEWASSRT